MSKEKQIEEMAKVICLSYGKGVCRQCNDCDFCTVRQEAERLYNTGYRKQNEWISVDERLPNESGYFLVYIPRESAGFRVNAYYYCENETWENGNGRASSEYYGITHWMHLPEPPKMKGGAECT